MPPTRPEEEAPTSDEPVSEPTASEPTASEPTPGGSKFGQRFRTRWTRWRRDGARAQHVAPLAPELDVEVPLRTAFVLAGGGSRGAVQVGMLSELVRRGIRADRVFGASVGAINGAAYAGRPSAEGMQRMADVWLGVRGPEIFPRGTFDGPWAFFQKRAAVHANSGLRAVIEAGIDFTNLEDAEIPLEVVTTSLTDGRERWISSGPAVDAILASSAIPSIFPPVTIDGDVLVDGGVVNNVPISRAIAVGCNRIYVLLCGPLHYRPPASRRPAEAALTAFFVAVHARFVRELATLPPGIEVVVFSGGGEPAGQYRDFSATASLIEEGRVEVASVLDRVGEASETDEDGAETVGTLVTPGTPSTAGTPGTLHAETPPPAPDDKSASRSSRPDGTAEPASAEEDPARQTATPWP
jgi:NTE family protein